MVSGTGNEWMKFVRYMGGSEDPPCPKCDRPTYSKGFARTKNGKARRWLCRTCNFQFSFYMISTHRKKYDRMRSAVQMYQKGYSTGYIAQYYQVSETSVQKWLKSAAKNDSQLADRIASVKRSEYVINRHGEYRKRKL